MALSKELRTAADIKKHEAANRAAQAALANVVNTAERDKQIRSYNELLDAGRIVGNGARTLTVPTDVSLEIKDAAGKIRRTIEGWHIDSMRGRYPGAIGHKTGRMGVMLTSRGEFIGFRTDSYTDAFNPITERVAPIRLTVTQEPGSTAHTLVPDEVGLAMQEAAGGIGQLTHVTDKDSVTVSSAYEALASFAVDNGLV